MKKQFLISKMLPCISVLLLLFLITGNGGANDAGWQKIVEAAKKEGKLVIAGPPGNNYRNAILDFKKQYPKIEIEFQGGSGRDFAPKIIAEQKASQFLWDVLIGGPDTMLTSLIPAGALDPFPRDLPETRAGINDQKWNKGFDEGLLDKEKKYIYAFTAYVQAAYVNRDVVSESDLKTMQDLLKPMFKKKISWNEPRKTGSGSALTTSLLINYGEDFLRQLLSQQQIVVTEDLRQQVDWLVRGVYPVAFGIANEALNDFQSKGLGKNVKRINDPKAGALSQGFGVVSLMKNASHANAAKVFTNWLLSKEGQTIWANTTKINSRRMDVPVANREFYAGPDNQYPFLGKEQYETDRNKSVEIAKQALK